MQEAGYIHAHLYVMAGVTQTAGLFSRKPSPKLLLFMCLCFTLGFLMHRASISLHSSGVMTSTHAHTTTLNACKLWKNLTNGVLDCVTGAVTRWLPRGRTLAEVESGIILVNHSQPISGSIVHETSKGRQRSFVSIFRNKLWEGQRNPEPGSNKIIGSGPGSTLENSVNVTRNLNAVINEIKLILGKSRVHMLDIPCGDLTWMSEVMSNRYDVIYHGMDIVPEIVEHHTRVYTSKHPHMTFSTRDIVVRPLTGAFVLILTRQMTQHLTSEDTMRVLKHFKDSGSKFLMATTVPSVGRSEVNLHHVMRHRKQNLEAPPVGLPTPLCLSVYLDTEYNGVWMLNHTS